MGAMASFGLLLDMLGAILLLGPEFKFVGNSLQRLNPLHHLLRWGLSKDTGTEIQANSLSFTFARWYINRNIENKKIGKHEAIVFTPPFIHFDANKWNYEVRDGNLSIAGPQPEDFEQYRSINIQTVWSIFQDDEEQWMFRVGLLLLLTGFSLQFVAQAQIGFDIANR